MYHAYDRVAFPPFGRRTLGSKLAEAAGSILPNLSTNSRMLLLNISILALRTVM